MNARTNSIWKNPLFIGLIGTIIGALIAVTPQIYRMLINSDNIPPNKPKIRGDVVRTTESGSVPKVIISYDNGDDNIGGSGLKAVRLWYRISEEGEWKKTEYDKTVGSGKITFANFTDYGQYFFDLVATDQRGNHTSIPDGTVSGQETFYYSNKEEPSVTSSVGKTSADQKLQKFNINNPEFAKKLGWIDIPVYFHVIHDGDEGMLDDNKIHEQIGVLNSAFFDGKITFSLVKIDRTDNAEWFRLAYRSEQERNMKSSLQHDPKKSFNIYTAELRGGLLGWSTFPFELSSDPKLDGNVILYSTLPGGTSAPFNYGNTLVHAAGHWLGLYHTFQGGCDGVGDHVADTVAHSVANFGKPKDGMRNNACNENEVAPVRNFMNYVDDDWVNHFTPGQFERIKDMIGIYRSELL